MGFQGASLAAHQREIKVEDDERGQEEGGLQQQHCFRDHARRARGGEETRTLSWWFHQLLCSALF